MLNPAELKREITKLQNRFLRLSATKKNIRENKEDFIYNLDGKLYSNLHEAAINHFI